MCIKTKFVRITTEVIDFLDKKEKMKKLLID